MTAPPTTIPLATRMLALLSRGSAALDVEHVRIHPAAQVVSIRVRELVPGTRMPDAPADAPAPDPVQVSAATFDVGLHELPRPLADRARTLAAELAQFVQDTTGLPCAVQPVPAAPRSADPLAFANGLRAPGERVDEAGVRTVVDASVAAVREPGAST